MVGGGGGRVDGWIFSKEMFRKKSVLSVLIFVDQLFAPL